VKIRRSFFIRWLQALNEEEQEYSVIDVEHVQTGNKYRAQSIEEAGQWMSAAAAKEEHFSGEDAIKTGSEAGRV
jgi:hypothetical protein